MTLFQKHQLPLSRAYLKEEIFIPHRSQLPSLQIFHQQLDRINELHNTGSEPVTLHSTFLNGIIRVQVGIDYSAGKSSQFWNGVNIIIEHPFKQFSDLTM